MDQLLIALDVPTAARAVELVESLGDLAGGFKIGSQLFTAEGPRLVRDIAARGHRVFLDLKFHDIPNTVAGAVRAAADLNVWMLTLHASGGTAMMRAAARAARDAVSSARPLLVAVTALTSLGPQDLAELGVARSIADHVDALAGLARDAGLDGIVCSPLEIRRLRGRYGSDFKIVTPGVRIADALNDRPEDDQVRTMGPREAIRASADYIVVGRPIIAAGDPRAAARMIAGALQQGFPSP